MKPSVGVFSRDISDIFIIVFVLCTVLFTSITVTSDINQNLTTGVVRLESLEDWTMYRYTAADDSCDDACDDDDIDPNINNKPSAIIYSIEPNPAHELSDEITFEGYGEDGDGYIIGHLWTSTIDGFINDNPIFTTNALSAGVHTILFYVEDDKGLWSEPANISLEIFENIAPYAPVIAGASKVKKGEPEEYRFITTDLNGDDVFYFVAWGDATTQDWIGPYKTDEEVTITHTWDSRGSHIISAKSKDVYGQESEWTTYTVSVSLFNQLYLVLQRFLAIHPFSSVQLPLF